MTNDTTTPARVPSDYERAENAQRHDQARRALFPAPAVPAPAWLDLDAAIAPELRRRLEEHQRRVAETIVQVRSVFEEAQASLLQLEPALGQLPEEGFDWIMRHTVYGDLDHLLRAFAAVVAPDDTMTGDPDGLDAELAKVPGLHR